MVNLLGAPNHTGNAIYEGLSMMQMPGVHIHLCGKNNNSQEDGILRLQMKKCLY